MIEPLGALTWYSTCAESCSVRWSTSRYGSLPSGVVMVNRWSIAHATVMPERAQRNARVERSSPSAWKVGLSTRSSRVSARRGSSSEPWAASESWYSSSPSWRLRICELITTAASESSSSTSSDITATCFSWKLTIRSLVTRTFLPPGVRQLKRRRRTPSRKSRERS